MLVSLEVLMNGCVLAYQVQIQGHADQLCMGSSGCGDEDGLRAAVLHAVFGICEESHG